MAKHVIEEELLKGSGFNEITNGEVSITATNADRLISLKTDGTIDLDIKNNELWITSRVPVFTTLEW